MAAMSHKDANPDNRPTRVSFPITEPKEELSSAMAEERAAPNRLQADDYNQLADLRSTIGRVSRLLLEGGSLQQALDAIEETLGNPIAVLRSRDGEWRSRGLGAPDAAPLVAEAAAYVRREGERSSASGFVGTDDGRSVYIHWIANRLTNPTAIALFELNRSVTALDMLMLTRLSAFLDLEMANIDAVREVEGKYLELFLQDWLAGKIVSERDWTARAEVCGCELNRAGPLSVAVVGLAEAGSDEADGKAADLARRLRTGGRRPGSELLAAAYGGELVLILSDGGERDRDETSAEAQLRGLLGELRGGARIAGAQAVRRPPGRNAGAAADQSVASEKGEAGRRSLRSGGRSRFLR
ncbi:hypothetical protein [Cohnella rhizosphaerae]|uniref:CdaR GGDEF-like domain-containing protein n=1 Tax=Cohnella rhizosphaerae TaxID=1457232 RepID=A0A9X4L4D4_9BACL|nr:hypothetical protein [Cohnella rhizosphaerae]MDG0813232.1 hypothetical protein [Cohnella rhizosphaerae]